jgi:flagellar basal-body rod protein FlgF
MMVQTTNGPAYTRNGRIVVSPEGFLTTGGRILIGASGEPIQVPVGTTPLINELGAVTVGNVEIDRLALFKIQGPAAHVGPSLYTAGTGGAVVPASFDNGVTTGQLEMANATALDATVQMIGAQRQFETAMQAIQTYRRLDDRVIEVGKSR